MFAKLFSIIILFLFLTGMPLFSFAKNINGEQIYLQNCMVCHGDDGSGAMPGVPDLAENKDFFIIDDLTLIKRIKAGIEKTGASIIMPPKGGNPDLTDRQLQSVVVYLRQLLKK